MVRPGMGLAVHHGRDRGTLLPPGGGGVTLCTPPPHHTKDPLSDGAEAAEAAGGGHAQLGVHGKGRGVGQACELKAGISGAWEWELW